jgi:pyridoxal phosphate enzyme (YggS family)
LTDIAANVAAIRARIAAAAGRVDRNPATIVLVAAAKQQSAAAVAAAVAAGVTDIGENYVQEGVAKRAAVHASARWHMIGHLQRNKVGKVLETFDVIHTVDSLELGTAIASRAQARNVVAHVCVEVNVADESSKSGIAPRDAPQLVEQLAALHGIRVDGLMAIPPAGPSEVVRPYFQRLRKLRDVLGLHELSMGMTDDFEVAIEEGATIVRIGRAIFGARG